MNRAVKPSEFACKWKKLRTDVWGAVRLLIDFSRWLSVA